VTLLEQYYHWALEKECPHEPFPKEASFARYRWASIKY
jgi:hypothetical protein